MIDRKIKTIVEKPLALHRNNKKVFPQREHVAADTAVVQSEKATVSRRQQIILCNVVKCCYVLKA